MEAQDGVFGDREAKYMLALHCSHYVPHGLVSPTHARPGPALGHDLDAAVALPYRYIHATAAT